MLKRKQFTDLSIRQKRRRRKQQLESDFGEAYLEQLSLCSVQESPVNVGGANCEVPASTVFHNEDDINTTSVIEDPHPMSRGIIGAGDNDNFVGNCFSSGSPSAKWPLDPNPFENTHRLRRGVTEDLQSRTDEDFSLRSGLAEWASHCYVRNVTVNRLLGVLRKAGHDELPMDARTLLQTPRRSDVTEFSKGSYIHYGLEKSLLYELGNCDLNFLTSEIMMDINVDGLPLSKSSQSSLWPILGRIVHLGFRTPFLIGAYHYNSKPSSAEEFMTPFIDEYVHLHTEGFYHEGRKYTPSIRAVICDSPARCFVTCTKQYNGYYGCPKCTTEGTYLRFVTFPDLNAPLRTNVDFRNRRQKEHHTGTSPLERTSLDMITQIPLDYMHVILLGIMKKLLLMWLTGKGVFSQFARNTLSERLINLRKWIPREFSRKPRGINEIRMWKATEFRLFLLYIGASVLIDLLPETHLIHFIALSSACRILCDPDDCLQNNSTAKDLLVWFVQRFVILYGASELVSNIHNLIHINEDVKKFGPLDSYSAFPFENFMQHLKRLLRSYTSPLPQLHRRLTEMMRYRRPFDDRQGGPVLLNSSTGNLPFGCRQPHTAIRFQDFYLSLRRPDNCCFMKDGSVVVIEHIGYRNETQVILGRKFKELLSMPFYPFDSKMINMHLATNLSNLKVWSISDITRKAVMLPVNKTQFHVMPLLHRSNE